MTTYCTNIVQFGENRLFRGRVSGVGLFGLPQRDHSVVFGLRLSGRKNFNWRRNWEDCILRKYIITENCICYTATYGTLYILRK